MDEKPPAASAQQAEHIPVLLQETIAGLVHSLSGTYVDATFGRGGHSRALLALLNPDARVVALDRDAEAVAIATQLAQQDPRLLVRQAAFADIAAVLESLNIEIVQGVLMDLGVSSPQLDNPHRGFSFRFNAPLDMRMDTSTGLTAAQWLNSAEQEDIADVIFRFGEERFARRIAQRIVAARPLASTDDLSELVKSAVPARFHGGKHPATRTFQAIRIYINQEQEQLRAGLEAAFAALAVPGRLAVISFHSLEDRMVKQAFRRLSRPPAMPRRVPVRHQPGQVPGRTLNGPVRPGPRELSHNPRARSATLRIIEKISNQAAS